MSRAGPENFERRILAQTGQVHPLEKVFEQRANDRNRKYGRRPSSKVQSACLRLECGNDVQRYIDIALHGLDIRPKQVRSVCVPDHAQLVLPAVRAPFWINLN